MTYKMNDEQGNKVEIQVIYYVNANGIEEPYLIKINNNRLLTADYTESLWHLQSCRIDRVSRIALLALLAAVASIALNIFWLCT